MKGFSKPQLSHWKVDGGVNNSSNDDMLLTDFREGQK